MNVAAFYATYRPISITSPSGPKEAQLRDIEQIFSPRFSKSRTKQTDEVEITLSTALQSLNEHIADKTAQAAHAEEAPSPQKDLFRVVDASGNHFKIVSAPQHVHRPFQPPPVPTPLTQQQLDALNGQATSTEDANETTLAAQLEAQVEKQDPELAAARGRRDRAKLDAIFNSSKGSQTAEIVLNTTMSSLRERFSFFTPTEPAAVKEPSKAVHLGHRTRRGFAVREPGTRKTVFAISVKRQRRLKMKKHKYKKVSRSILTTSGGQR